MRGLNFLRTNWLGILVLVALFMLWRWLRGAPAPAPAPASTPAATAAAPAVAPAGAPASTPAPSARRMRGGAAPAGAPALAPVPAGPNWQEVFADKISDPNPAVRAGVVDCVIGLDAVGALPILVSLMVDKNEPVAQHAAKALIGLGDKAVEPLVQAGLKSGDEKLMERSSVILVRIATPSVTTSLIDVLSDPNPRVRYHAKKALYLLGANLALEDTVRRGGDAVRTAEAQDALLWIRNRKPLVSWTPPAAQPVPSSGPQKELEEQLAELEKLGDSGPGKLVYVDGRDKLAPAMMASKEFNRKIMALPSKERRAVLKAREAYFRALREP